MPHPILFFGITYLSINRYEREEVFFALNVTVKNATLQDSLAQFVKGELLDGDNQYFCEKCGEKVIDLAGSIFISAYGRPSFLLNILMLINSNSFQQSLK